MDLYPAHGARSISELARSAMQNIIRGAQEDLGDRTVLEALRAIDKTVSEMNLSLKGLMAAAGKDDKRRDNA